MAERTYESRQCLCGHWVTVFGDFDTYNFVETSLGKDGTCILILMCPVCDPDGRVPIKLIPRDRQGLSSPFHIRVSVGATQKESEERAQITICS